MKIRLYSSLARHFVATALVGLSLVPGVRSQPVHVQFIHASANAEASELDIYRDGELWLDDFAFAHATPFEDWGAGRRFRLEFTAADALDNSNPFFSTTLTLTTPDTLFISNPQVPYLTRLMPVGIPAYILTVAGDPLKRTGQPSFDLHVMSGALNQWSFYPPFPAVGGFNASPDLPVYAPHWRGTSESNFIGKINLYPDTGFGDFMPYVTAPSVLFDDDSRGLETPTVEPPAPFNLVDSELRERYDHAVTPSGKTSGSIYHSHVIDFTNKQALAFINVSAGFLHPPQTGDSEFRVFSVFGDGTTEVARNNTASVQWIHNSPYREVPVVDLYINGFLVVDDLHFREATPF
ncbi:MAG: DUF4397 domain-containing protein, partial [Rhodothermales bacterium]|nr:DUF4397 domain-containing protein [Rhodothermales bacterium]